MTDGKVKFSFSMNKAQNGKPNKNSVFKDESLKEDKDSIEYIREIDGKAIKSVNPVKKAEEVVIPLIQSKKPKLDKIKDCRSPQTAPPSAATAATQDRLASVTDALKKEAMEKIMQESQQRQAEDACDLVIPLSTAAGDHPPPEKEEEEEEEHKEEEVADADYAAVAVESFGLAMLRGMGSPAEIAARLSSSTAALSRRPRGLGLGAAVAKESAANAASPGRDEEALVLRPGARCCVLQGRNRGRYATVESVDGNADRLVLRLAIGGRMAVTCPIAAVRLVADSEFAKYSKYLNRDKAERVKKEEEERMEKEVKRRRMEEEETWVQERLRVRIVDRKYAAGRHYKEKVVVRKVTGRTVVGCTQDGETLDDLRADLLETVIPRDDGARVMVVRGRRRGDVGRIVSRDARRCEAVVELSRGSRRDFHFDDLCEVV